MNTKKIEYAFGILDFKNDSKEKQIEFYRPVNLKWSCQNCGKCCGDTEKHERRVLLTEKDIKRISENGHKDFYDTEQDGVFIGIIKKKNGRCIFQGQGECKIYSKRALLCRMYPFWVERNENVFQIKVDENCSGFDKGKILDEDFFKELLSYSLYQIEQ
jgi:Fe-S-cluster containining protein